MAHNIPKIVYGALNNTILLDYPAKNFGGDDEQDNSVASQMMSLSGITQTNLSYIEVQRAMIFGAISETKKVALRSFFRTWAALGKPFKFFEDQNGVAYTIYELAKLEFKPKKTGIAGENAFTYEVPMSVRRAEDANMTDYFEAQILNNQASAVDLVGVVLDQSAYKSVKLFCEIRRTTGTTERVHNGYLTANYKVGTGLWAITPVGTFDTEDGDHGMIFTTNGSQIQYTSDNMSGGSHVGTFRLKSLTF